MKINTGDRIEIRHDGAAGMVYAGVEGTIVSIDEESNYPYEVLLDGWAYTTFFTELDFHDNAVYEDFSEYND